MLWPQGTIKLKEIAMKKLPPFLAAAALLLGVAAASAQGPKTAPNEVLAPFCNTQVVNSDGILIDTSKLVDDRSYCSPVIREEKLRSASPADQRNPGRSSAREVGNQDEGARG